MSGHRFRTTRKASTTARGYGSSHAKERARRLPLFTASSPCGYCGRPLGENRTAWHLPHNENRTGYLPGFWHARCNTLEGARRGAVIGNRRQRMVLARRRAQSRAW